MKSAATESGPVIIKPLANGKQRIFSTMDVRFSDNRQRDGYLEFTRNHPVLRKADVVYKGDSRAIISTAWEGSTSYGALMEKNCVYTAPITQEKGGYEVHTILAKKPKEIRDALKELSILGEVKLMKAKEMAKEMPFSLTQKQAKALRIAKALGYYSWPRKVGLQEMAEYCGMTRRAFQENLRKAEAKAIPEFLEREAGI